MGRGSIVPWAYLEVVDGSTGPFEAADFDIGAGSVVGPGSVVVGVGSDVLILQI
jgi:hypothetical protein